ncbi:MAG: DUF5702 domain-containing protein [Halanaerobiales bacterium]
MSISKYHQFEANLSGDAKLIANSILSKYDKELFNNYGVLATDGSLNNKEKTRFINEVNQPPFRVNHFDMKYSKSLISVNNLKNSIISYQTNRFIYNSSKKLISAILSREKNENNEDVLSGFKTIAELYEEVLEDYESLNNLLIAFRNRHSNLYDDFVAEINKEETYIVNIINEIRNQPQEDTELEIDSKINNIVSSAKYISKEVDSICNHYKGYSDILNNILLKIRTLESKVNEIKNLSEQFYKLESNSENQNLKIIIDNSKEFNNLINDNELKTKVKINLEKSKDIIKELDNLDILVQEDGSTKKINYEQLKRFNLEWVKDLSSDLRIISYISLTNTEFNSLNIYQNEIEEALGNDTDFKDLISNLKSIFGSEDLDFNTKTINAENAEKLYSNNYENELNSEDLVNKTFSKVIMVDYINELFNCYTTEKVSESFFNKSEMEYILNGKYSNEDNIKTTKKKIIALRTASNLQYILTNPEMMNFIGEFSLTFSSINPILTPIIKIVLISTIAVTEANIDYHRMIKNKKVPFLKDGDSWNLSINSLRKIYKGNFDFNIKDSDNGLDYNNYLSILIFFSKEESITKRVGDLIQLNNMQNNEDLLDFSKLYQCVNVKIDGTYSMFNKFNLLKLKVVEEGDYQY